MADLLNLANHAAGQPQRQVIYGQLSLKQPAPSSFGSPLYVVIPDWSTDFYFKVPDWVACHGTTLPAQGTDCLLIKDDRANLRCVWWAGVTTSVPTGAAGGYDVVGTYPSQLQVRGILNASHDSSSPFTHGSGQSGSTYSDPYFLPGGTAGSSQPRRRYFRTTNSDVNPRRLWLFYKSRDTANWEVGGPIRITVWTTYYQGSYTRSVFSSGWADNQGGAPTLVTVEAGGPKPIAPSTGAEQTASGTVKFTGVYIDLPAYAFVVAEVEYGEAEVAGSGAITGGGQISLDGTEQTNTGAGAFFNTNALVPGGLGADLAATVASRRTLGTGALQALPGNTSLGMTRYAVFTANGSWNIPASVTQVRIRATGAGAGGGGGGGGSSVGQAGGGGGGGGAGAVIDQVISLDASDTQLTLAMGTGGAAGSGTVGNGGAGGNVGTPSSAVGNVSAKTYVSAAGGSGGGGGTGGASGTGGGAGGFPAGVSGPAAGSGGAGGAGNGGGVGTAGNPSGPLFIAVVGGGGGGGGGNTAGGVAAGGGSGQASGAALATQAAGGAAGNGQVTGGAGQAATLPGCGGGGGGGGSPTSGLAKSGGNGGQGAPGQIEIWW